MKIVLSSIIFFLVNAFVAQTIIAGKVYKSDSAGYITPAEGVNVAFQNVGGGTVTNIIGEFELEAPKNAETIVFSFVGFEEEAIKIDKIENPITVILDQGEILTEVTIKATEDGYRIEKYNPRDAHVMGQGELRKAACCNLAESFETNPFIDASFTDAVTGTKQIKMLGLSGKYVQITEDNLPAVRGLSTIYGLELIPGAWINSIHISKGAGSVANGFESITGQINVGMKSPGNAEKLHVNAYFNSAFRSELNVIHAFKAGKNWGSVLLVHGKFADGKMDMNGDSFIDNPLNQTVVIQNIWNYHGPKIHTELSLSYANLNTQGGQFKELTISSHEEHQHTPISDNPYRINTFTQRVNGYAKVGYLFPDENYKSIALQLKGETYYQLANFGFNNYNGKQNSAYANLLYQDDWGCGGRHKYRTGLSYQMDAYHEAARNILPTDTSFVWTEHVPGAFLEYSFTRPIFGAVIGARGDYHNIYGAFFTPRANFRWNPHENTTLKLAGGMGRRTPNIFMENLGVLASSRTWQVINPNANAIYGLKQEIATNVGLAFQQEFKLAGREAFFNVDIYRTWYQNQVVTDLDENAQQFLLYNLDGASYANSFQVETNLEPVKRISLRMAYRFLDVQTEYLSGLNAVPLVASHRGFVNIEKETRQNKEGSFWKFDATGQWIGAQRLPNTIMSPAEYQLPENSPAFFQLNAQVTYLIKKKWEIYLGAENITNYRLDAPIVSADNPYGDNFDASMVYGPVFGRMFYTGVRFTIE